MGLLGAARAGAEDGLVADQPNAAMRVYRDPESGRIGGPPPAALVERSTAIPAGDLPGAAGLTAEPVTAPAGGVKINLGGRFRAAVRRQAGASGAATHECVDAGTAANE